ncbi:MAG: hypothetical protein MUO31_04090 [Thermodesulfovibrionales bacterium]|nr:hypothetical protein [Thermodesulfovibrionales bacterium]
MEKDKKELKEAEIKHKIDTEKLNSARIRLHKFSLRVNSSKAKVYTAKTA